MPFFPAVGYCGRMKLPNLTPFLAVKQGDRIAQLVLEKVNLSAFSLLPLAHCVQGLFDLGFPITWIDAAVTLDLYTGSDSGGGTSRERQGRRWVWKYRIGLIECRLWLWLRNLWNTAGTFQHQGAGAGSLKPEYVGKMLK